MSPVPRAPTPQPPESPLPHLPRLVCNSGPLKSDATPARKQKVTHGSNAKWSGTPISTTLCIPAKILDMLHHSPLLRRARVLCASLQCFFPSSPPFTLSLLLFSSLPDAAVLQKGETGRRCSGSERSSFLFLSTGSFHSVTPCALKIVLQTTKLL